MTKLPYKKCLLITSSGGGGHLQATAAKAHELHTEHPHIEVIQRDFMLDFLGKYTGGFLAGCWNFAQRRGIVIFQKIMGKGQSKIEFFFRFAAFCKILRLLLKEDIDYIIDNQPLGTPGIIKAIYLVQKYKGRKVRYEKHLIDLPTNRAIHYFKGIKQLRYKERKLVYIYTTHPLLDTHESEEAFWQDHTNLPPENIIYSEFPLRPSFREHSDRLPKHKNLSLAARIPTLETWECIKDILALGELEHDYCAPYLDFTIPAHSNVTLLMLGSRPAEKATLGYVQSFISYKREHPNNTHEILFVFCRKHHHFKRSLLSKVCDAIRTEIEFPKNLTIVPLTFQDDLLIAPLFARADATITRSGGITSMELLSTMEGQIMIHSEAKADATTPLEKLLKGIPVWEKGNARYLQAKKQAHIVTPEILIHTITTH